MTYTCIVHSSWQTVSCPLYSFQNSQYITLLQIGVIFYHGKRFSQDTSRNALETGAFTSTKGNSGLSKRFRVAGDAKKVEGGPTNHETNLTPVAALIILI